MPTAIGSTTLYCDNEMEWRYACEPDRCVSEPGPEAQTLANAIVLPLRPIPGTKVFGDALFEGGVTTADGAFVAGQRRRFDGGPCNRSCLTAYQPNPSEMDYRAEDVIFGGILTHHWGHMLLDSTSRLWYMASGKNASRKTVFVSIPNESFPFSRLIELMGLPQGSYEVISRPTKFSSVTIPQESSFALDGKFTRHWQELFRYVREQVEPAPYSRVYLSRTALGQQNVVGETYFERFFANQGYFVAHTEQLPIRDQVALLKGAQSIATTMGTLAHMVMFAEPGTELIVLNRTGSIIQAQVGIAQASGAQCTFVDAHMNFLPDRQANNAPVLLAPGQHWAEFAHDRFGVQRDACFENEGLADYVLDYLKKWSLFYSEPKRFERIRDFELREVAARMNTMLNGVSTKKETLPEPMEIERLRSRVKNAELNCGQQDQRQRGHVKEIHIAEAVWGEGALCLRGNTAVEEGVSLKRVGILGESGFRTLSDVESKMLTPSQLIWEARISLDDVASLSHVVQDAAQAQQQIIAQTADGAYGLVSTQEVDGIPGTVTFKVRSGVIGARIARASNRGVAIPLSIESEKRGTSSITRIGSNFDPGILSELKECSYHADSGPFVVPCLREGALALLVGGPGLLVEEVEVDAVDWQGDVLALAGVARSHCDDVYKAGIETSLVLLASAKGRDLPFVELEHIAPAVLKRVQCGVQVWSAAASKRQISIALSRLQKRAGFESASLGLALRSKGVCDAIILGPLRIEGVQTGFVRHGVRCGLTSYMRARWPKLQPMSFEQFGVRDVPQAIVRRLR